MNCCVCIVTKLYTGFLQKPLKYKVAISRDSRDWFKRYRSQSFLCDDELPIQTDEMDFFMAEVDSVDQNSEGQSCSPTISFSYFFLFFITGYLESV